MCNGVASANINQSINQSYLLTWPKERTATSRSTKEKTVCTEKRQDQGRNDGISAFLVVA